MLVGSGFELSIPISKLADDSFLGDVRNIATAGGPRQFGAPLSGRCPVGKSAARLVGDGSGDCRRAWPRIAGPYEPT
jgi:hypothetical protein